MERKKIVTNLIKTLAAFLAAVIFFGIVIYPYWMKQINFILREAKKKPLSNFMSASKEEPNHLWVLRLDISAPIIYAASADENVFQADLKNGVVHYPDTADIGMAGNAYLFGHSSDYIWSKGNFKTIFALLPKIKIGDEIFATDQKGNKFIYRVIETRVVHPDDISVLDQQNNKRKLLTLQTSYPIGTALWRFVAIAELVEK